MVSGSLVSWQLPFDRVRTGFNSSSALLAVSLRLDKDARCVDDKSRPLSPVACGSMGARNESGLVNSLEAEVENPSAPTALSDEETKSCTVVHVSGELSPNLCI